MTTLTPSRYYARVFALVTAGVLGYLLFRLLSPFTAPLLWASMLAFMLAPMNEKLLRWKRRPALASGLLTGATFLVIVGPVTFFVFAFIRQASDLLARFQAEATERKLPALQMILELRPVQALIEKAGEFTSLSPQQILHSAAETAQGLLQQVATLGGTVVVGAVNIITQFSLTMFILFFFLRDGKGMLERAIRLIPMAPARKTDLAATLGGVARAVVLGTLATSLVQGTLLGVGFAIAGMPSPLVFGALGAVASLIPIVGTGLIWLPAVITLVAQGEVGWAIFLALWSMILVGGSDNVIRPLIISGNSKASTLLVFIGLLGGLGTFGFAGIFMGPLILTLVATLMQYADSELPKLSLVSGPPIASQPLVEAAPPVITTTSAPTQPPAPETRVDKPMGD